MPRRSCADPERRARLEADPQAWLVWYLAGTYTRPFERPHREIVAGVMQAHETHGRFVVAAERGIGKSAILWGMILYLAMTGRQIFPVCVPWADGNLKKAFSWWKRQLCFEDKLDADYPEYTAPFRHAKGVPQRVMTTTWEDTHDMTGARLAVGEGIIVFPDSLGCMGGSTINGNIRGLNHTQDDGGLLRPSIVLVDDVQDRKTAKSVVQTADTIAIIDGDVGGCGEAGRDMPMLMACNCIRPQDVSAHYLASAEWQALRIPCVEAWPKGWDDPKHKVHELWEEWHEKVQAGKGALTFYRTNKKAMTKDMKLSAPATFAGKRGCPDAFYGVFQNYYSMGHEAFMAERQQSPVDPIEAAGPYTLTAKIVESRGTKRTIRERPEWVSSVIISTDVNPSYALSTVVLGFGQDHSCAVMWYGLHKCAIAHDISAPEHARQLYGVLVAHGQELAGSGLAYDYWAIDAGGANFDAVLRFSGESNRVCGIPAHGYTGRGYDKYNEYGKTYPKNQPRREQCHLRGDYKDGRWIRWVVWQTDYWKEIMQRAWLGDVGAPGAASLPDGIHGEFARQVCASKLIAKGEFGGKMAWKWHEVPGKRDYFDAMGQGYAAAAFEGIGTGSSNYRKPSKARVLVSRPSQRR